MKNIYKRDLFQPFFDIFGSTWITRAHHASIVHNHAFPIDDKEVGNTVDVQLVVHLVYLVFGLKVIGMDVFDAVHVHTVFIQDLFVLFPVVVSTDRNEYDVVCAIFLSEFL